MSLDRSVTTNKSELHPVIGLTRGMQCSDIELLTVKAIRVHRQLVEKADQFFQALPEEFHTGKSVGGEQHLEYIEAMIEMHAQMRTVNALVDMLGYIPRVSIN